MSFKKYLVLPLIFCAAHFASADTIQLKDSSAVTGKILAEKPDSVVVDVGYTVLVVPRTRNCRHYQDGQCFIGDLSGRFIAGCHAAILYRRRAESRRRTMSRTS